MIIKFGRHKGTEFGHIIERKKKGYPSRWCNRRLKVSLIEGRWIDENGRDVNDDVTTILLTSYMKGQNNETNNNTERL
jgi:hypothetical protein